MADLSPLGDPLYLACTRPATIWGAPIEALGLNMIVSGFAFLAGGDLAWLLLAPALHLVAREIVRHDPHAFRVLALAFQSSATRPGRARWGGRTRDPLACRRTPAR